LRKTREVGGGRPREVLRRIPADRGGIKWEVWGDLFMLAKISESQIKVGILRS
jgi:hypothetical protein